MRADPIADPRLRVLAVLGLAFSFSTLHAPVALTLMAGLTVILIWWSRLPPKRLLRALRLPGVVVAGLVAVLPFTSGDTTIASLGPLSLRAEGLTAAAGIALRFVAIFALIVVFLGALPVSHLIAALRGLGLPILLVDMALLTLRHIEDLRHDLARMQTAMRLRGGRGGTRPFARFRSTGWLLASLLLRSHARSERVYHAMILRGHGATGAALPDRMPVLRSDKLVLAALFGLAACLLAVERLA
ncbi:cobalt ECF transporter T component CbiQ [Yoonia vestfoldensis]|uniref:cobalt ECF transporter T component CbiQ n=1 Tax=Yoonia vestfoldensis TaxID=245188 RepID=UPI00036A5D1F|nr:cobalt ECF transporter T component CbiQ [Yoonia vestfoldensis]